MKSLFKGLFNLLKAFPKTIVHEDDNNKYGYFVKKHKGGDTPGSGDVIWYTAGYKYKIYLFGKWRMTARYCFGSQSEKEIAKFCVDNQLNIPEEIVSPGLYGFWVAWFFNLPIVILLWWLAKVIFKF